MINYEQIFLVSLNIVLLGLIACRPFYKSWKLYLSSSLFIKILMWLPILGVFVLFMKYPGFVRVSILSLILIYATFELFHGRRGFLKSRLFLLIHLSAGAVALFVLALPSNNQQELVLFTVYASVISDVAAFFMGNYAGKHKLPKIINNRKSWEGVMGQIIGAFMGGVLVNTYFIEVSKISLFVAVIVGLGTAYGDLLNSYVKRRLKIKDWGHSIPGHGGYSDRFSSMFGAVIFVYIWYILNL